MFRSSYRSRRHRNPHTHEEQQRPAQPFFAGNADVVVQRKTEDPFFQTKPGRFTINQPHDPFEQEANRVADAVVNGNAGADIVQQKKISNIQRMNKEIQQNPQLQRMCTECEEEEKEGLQSKAVQGTGNAAAASSSLSGRIESTAGAGQPLSAETLGEMNTSFGADFSNVHIHTGAESAQMNKELHAQAFTHGRDIYFSSGKYNPQSPAGKHLLAHELTHVIQQSGNTGSVQRQPSANAKAESQVENDRESFSIILARHYLATQRNVPFDPTQTTTCAAAGTNSNECLLVTQSGTSIKLMWNTETNIAIAKAIINNEGLACGFKYSIDDNSNITFTLIKCWKIFDI
jgi:hypothetical protein